MPEQNTVSLGRPIAGYYRGFKLSRHVRVSRELLVLPDDIAHLLFAYTIYPEPPDIAGSSIHHATVSCSLPSMVSVKITPACLYKALDIYQCMADVFQRLARYNISRCVHGLT